MGITPLRTVGITKSQTPESHTGERQQAVKAPLLRSSVSIFGGSLTKDSSISTLFFVFYTNQNAVPLGDTNGGVTDGIGFSTSSLLSRFCERCPILLPRLCL